MTEDQHGPIPPYVSFRTFFNLLDKLQEGGIPQRIDRSYWGDFLAGGYGMQVMTALRFFGLIDENNEATDDLEQLVKGDRKQKLNELLRAKYAPVFSSVDLSRVTSGHLEEVFRKQFGTTGQTTRKVMGFFIQAAQYAGIDVSSHVIQKTRTRGAAAKSPTRTARKPKGNGDVSGPNAEATPPSPANEEPSSNGKAKVVQLRSGGSLTLSYTVDLFSLSPHDRDFLFRIIDWLQEYENVDTVNTTEAEEVGSMAS